MLVPARDFQLDAWMGARMTVVRGVENGYAVLCVPRPLPDGLRHVLLQCAKPYYAAFFYILRKRRHNGRRLFHHGRANI
ncbi:hypothetical protein [Janthinobacterium sp. LB3P118]|uniref:hypothetical protein n=1 Tax=Janthinobacterium sp. LB3P118 TaxID=3424195 RepID=UPI003F25C7D9